MCATGEILWPETAPPSLALYPKAPLPAARPVASPQSLAPGRVLGTPYATRPCPTMRSWRYRTKPCLSTRKESCTPHFSLARNGDRLSVRGRVAERFERKGHQFVVLDIIVAADGERLVQHVRHTAIYELRPPTGG